MILHVVRGKCIMKEVLIWEIFTLEIAFRFQLFHLLIILLQLAMMQRKPLNENQFKMKLPIVSQILLSVNTGKKYPKTVNFRI